MATNWNYLIWLGLFVWAPTALLWLAFYRVLAQFPRTFGLVILGACAVSVPWDVVAVRTRIWRFPSGCCVGPRVFELPIEEYLFIIFVSVYVATLTLVIRHLTRARLAPS